MIAFLTYQFVTDSPVGIPLAWPAQTLQNTDTPPAPDWQVMSESDYNAYLSVHQSDFNAWLASCNAPNMQAIIGQKIKNAMDFGTQLMVEYGTKNVMRGYNVEQTRTVANELSELQSLLLSGSLYCARQVLIDVVPDNLVTQEDKDEFLAKLNAYLGMPS